jgi:hypothetical protein
MRYHFHIQDGHNMPDQQGTELPSLQAARVEAVERAGAVLQKSAQHFWNGEEWKLDVTDDKGLLMFSLVFVAFESPASRSANPIPAPVPHPDRNP